jgi:4-nitrophenyl phosphatase
VFYCTNSSAKSREDVLRRLHAAGIVDASLDCIYTSSSTTASYLHNLSQTQPDIFDINKHKVFAIGYTGLKTELLGRGIDAVLSEDAIDPHVHVRSAKLDPAFAAVVVGLDPAMSYVKCAYACRLIRERAALFVATNADATYPDAGGVLLPGAGSCVAMVARAAGRSPVVMGKPSLLMMDAVVRDHGLVRGRTLMVGDRRDTDVIFGNASGMHSLLVFTGVTRPEDFPVPTAPYVDDEALRPAANARAEDSEAPAEADVPTYVAEAMWWLTGEPRRANL